MAIKESILHNTLSVSEFREFEKYSHDLHFAPVKHEAESKSEPSAQESKEKPAKQNSPR